MTFCNLISVKSLPISQVNLARYIAYLASRLAYTSLKQYLNIVRLIHVEGGLPENGMPAGGQSDLVQRRLARLSDT